jgi:metal-sulfur cluster biosynthetic enzyme
MPSEAPTLPPENPALHPEIVDALRVVHDPCSVATGVPIDIVDMGLIGTVGREGTTVEIGLCLTAPVCWQAVGMATAIEASLLRLEGVEEVRCALDTSQYWMPDRMAPAARARLRAVRPHRRYTTQRADHVG